MSDEFEKEHREWLDNYKKSFGQLPDCSENAHWAREWFEKNRPSYFSQGKKIAKLQAENAKLRAKEINGTLRTYDGVVPKLEARIAQLEGALQKIAGGAPQEYIDIGAGMAWLMTQAIEILENAEES